MMYKVSVGNRGVSAHSNFKDAYEAAMNVKAELNPTTGIFSFWYDEDSNQLVIDYGSWSKYIYITCTPKDFDCFVKEFSI